MRFWHEVRVTETERYALATKDSLAEESVAVNS